jgi:hypothetical protein
MLLVVNTRVLDEQKRDFDEIISLCKREMTSEMVEKQDEIQEVLVGLAVESVENIKYLLVCFFDDDLFILF